MAKHRLYPGDAPVVDGLAHERVDLALHGLGEGLGCAGITAEEAHLAHLGFVGEFQAAAAQMTGATGRFRRGEFHRGVAVDGEVAAVAVEGVPRRADAGVLLRVVANVFVGGGFIPETRSGSICLARGGSPCGKPFIPLVRLTGLQVGRGHSDPGNYRLEWGFSTGSTTKISGGSRLARSLRTQRACQPASIHLDRLVRCCR